MLSVNRFEARCAACQIVEDELMDKIDAEKKAIEQEKMKKAASYQEQNEKLHESRMEVMKLRKEIEKLRSPLPEQAHNARLIEEINEFREESSKIRRLLEDVKIRSGEILE